MDFLTDIISATVPAFCRLSGLSKTTVWSLISSDGSKRSASVAGASCSSIAIAGLSSSNSAPRRKMRAAMRPCRRSTANGSGRQRSRPERSPNRLPGDGEAARANHDRTGRSREARVMWGNFDRSGSEPLKRKRRPDPDGASKLPKYQQAQSSGPYRSRQGQPMAAQLRAAWLSPRRSPRASSRATGGSSKKYLARVLHHDVVTVRHRDPRCARLSCGIRADGAMGSVQLGVCRSSSQGKGQAGGSERLGRR